MSHTSATTAQQALTGPVPTIRTPFTRDGAVDVDALHRMIDFDLDAGARAIVLTAGDSHFEALSDAQIAELTRITAQHVGDRALTVAADRAFSTSQAVAFARDCRAWGCDMLMVKPPDWARSCTPQTLADHYAAIGRELPVMMVTNVFIPRGDAFGFEVVRRTLETTDAVVSVKDDMGGAFARKLAAMVSDRWAVWAGGQKQNHLNMAAYGAQGYLSTFLTFKPDVAHRYWAAWSGGDLKEATRIIRTIDMPLFDFLATLEGGFDAGMHGLLELVGLAERWRPEPYHSMTDAQMEQLRGFCEQHALL